ncbi:HAMP domain-containing sensor histidine kinase [Parvularcula sp. IMCC14364]|uniref:sensor histidine kinase n=1 Tax=Parvularcula sp. IMCC14364 TaxID=3067902 RepID=UPI002740EFF2|nr:HAMP domain-containing sensor histidine kinase [Parvularcula sp. IMCC14364]
MTAGGKPQLVVIIAHHEWLRARLASVFQEADPSRYAHEVYPTFDAFLDTGCPADVDSFIIDDDVSLHQCVSSHRKITGRLLPVIRITDPETPEAARCTEKLPMSEVFGSKQVRADLLFTTLKYLNEVNTVIHEMGNLQSAIELADKTNTRFFQYMSHELSSPLQAAKTLQANIALLDDIDEIKSNARISTIAITHVLDAINNISEYVRVSKNQLSLQQEIFDVGSVLEELVCLFREHAAHKGLELVLALPSALDCQYKGDKLRLRQVLVNLIKNAIKFTEEGQITLSACRHGDTLRISVEDTGIGMAPELVADILGRNGYTPGADFDGGLGIGLMLSREFLASAGGHLDVESAPGKGSRFTAVLPNEFYVQHPEQPLRATG